MLIPLTRLSFNCWRNHKNRSRKSYWLLSRRKISVKTIFKVVDSNRNWIDLLTDNYSVFCFWSWTRLPGNRVFFWVTDLFFLIFRFRCSSPRNPLSSSRMFPSRCTCLTTNLSWYLPSLKQCCHGEAYRWYSWSNSYVQIFQHTKSRWVTSRLFPVLFHVRLEQNHVHTYREHPTHSDVRQDMAGTLHPPGGSLRWRKCYKIRVRFLPVLTHKECL